MKSWSQSMTKKYQIDKSAGCFEEGCIISYIEIYRKSHVRGGELKFEISRGDTWGGDGKFWVYLGGSQKSQKLFFSSWASNVIIVLFYINKFCNLIFSFLEKSSLIEKTLEICLDFISFCNFLLILICHFPIIFSDFHLTISI